LNDVRLLQSINTQCVPVAHSGLADNVYRVVTPGGKQLSQHIYPGLALKEGLEAWKKLPESERRLARGVPLPKLSNYTEPPNPPAGGLVLNVYTRGLQRDAGGALSAPNKVLVAGGSYSFPAEPQLDHLWVKEAEWKAVIPTSPKEGASTPVPDGLVRRIATFHLLDKCLGTPHHLWMVSRGTLTATVEKVTPTAVRLRLDGSAVLADYGPYPVRLLGYLTYNSAKKSITRFDLVALGRDGGDLRTGKEDRERGLLKYDVRPGCSPLMGVAFELAGRSPQDRVPPYGIMFQSGKAYNREYFAGAE